MSVCLRGSWVNAPGCPESGVGGEREKAAPEGRVVRFKRGTNGENLCIMMFFYELVPG